MLSSLLKKVQLEKPSLTEARVTNHSPRRCLKLLSNASVGENKMARNKGRGIVCKEQCATGSKILTEPEPDSIGIILAGTGLQA